MEHMMEHLDEFSLYAAAGFLIHWSMIIGFSARVIMRRRPVGVSLAWIAIIFSIPLIGVMIYLMIGENRICERYLKRAAAIREIYLDWQNDLRRRARTDAEMLDPLAAPLAHQVESLTGFPVLYGNRLELIEDYTSIFRAIIRDIHQAQTTCHLEFYIWHPGGLTDELQEALVAACDRGVICRLAVDAIGSKAFLRSPAAQALRDAGVRVVAALPAGLLRMFLSRADLRNHRKLIVIDGRIAYTGSQNMVDPRHFKQDAGVGQWVDAMVRLEGPAVESLAGSFIQDWEVISGAGVEKLAHTSDIRSVSSAGEVPIQVAPSGPAYRPMAIHQLLLTTLYAARRELVITTPYFVPDDALLAALASAAHRGVEVTLILPAHNDSRMVHYASRSFFEDLLDAGVRLACFEGGLLHTKSITVDGEFCMFGSVNLDMRSIWINFELSLFIYDRGFCGQVRRMQEDYLVRSRFLDLETWRQRPRREQFIENTVHLASPLL